MTKITFSRIEVGEALPPLTLPALDRTTLALFAGASGDHMTLHIDTDAARRAGMPDVFGHGMLSMAYLGRLLTGWAPPSALRSFSVRFLGITHLGNVITCTGKVIEKLERNGEELVRVDIQATNQYGELKTAGEALFALA
jgi:acyl dehydratase